MFEDDCQECRRLDKALRQELDKIRLARESAQRVDELLVGVLARLLEAEGTIRIAMELLNDASLPEGSRINRACIELGAYVSRRAHERAESDDSGKAR